MTSSPASGPPVTSAGHYSPGRRDPRAANTLVIVLLTIAVLSVVAGNLMFTAAARYHTTYQSASWQEALVAAESGVDLAMNELRERVLKGGGGAFQAPRWLDAAPGDRPPLSPPPTPEEQALLGIAIDPLTYHPGQGYPDGGRLFPLRPLSTHEGEGNGAMSARVYVDVPGSAALPAPALDSFAQNSPPTLDEFMNEQSDALGADPQSHWWYRIRSLGVAGVAGPPRANLDRRDNALRRFSFFNDWRNGSAVSAPQVGRVVEAVAKPRTNFRNALMADKFINLSNRDVLIDSYNSAKGLYDGVTNHGNLGNVATNGQLIDAGGAKVMGDAMTNDGRVKEGERVTGQQRSDFYQELLSLGPDFMGDAWNNPNVQSRFTLTESAVYTASPDRTRPTRVRLNGVNLPPDGKTISIIGPLRGVEGASGATPSYIKIYVDGDLVTRGSSAIQVAAGVNVIFYVSGNVNLEGDGLVNDSMIPGRVLLNGLQPPKPAGASRPARSIEIDTNQAFAAMIYAPDHDLSLRTTKPFSVNGDFLPPPIRPGGGGSGDDDDNSGPGGGDDDDDDDDASGIASIPQVQAALLALAHHPPITPALLTSLSHDYSRGYMGIYGAYIARTIMVRAKTHVHYDEALREAGPVNHYEIVNWFEDVASRLPATGQ